MIETLDYEHTRHGAPCSGILSQVDGRSEAVWNFDLDGAAACRTRPVSRATLAELWDGIARSLASRGVFWRNLVTDVTRPLDPELEHLIVVVVARGGRRRYLTFAVPIDDATPEFTAWLALLAVPASVTEVAAAE